ncbi:MAG: DNA repair protein Rad52 [Cytophagia bacterium]|nr:DNA repair protein Rad52 [Cytophagia bacterium]
MNDILTAPIQPNEIEWRVQQQTSTGKLIIVPYINNRCVMQRFDAAFGPTNWTSEFREIGNGFICRLTVTIDGWKVYREDGASKTNIEPEKGGISDAMKRAAVQFGLGRCLYDYPKVMIETDGKFIPDWAHDKLGKLVDWINAGNWKEIIILKP